MALVLQYKIAVLPDNIFAAMLNDRLVAKGTVLEVLTLFLQEYLVKESMDELVAILFKARVANRLLDFMPPTKRTVADFNEHFKVITGAEAIIQQQAASTHQHNLCSCIAGSLTSAS